MLTEIFIVCPSTAAAKFRRDSLFCPDELDSLFSYFDTGSGPRSKSSAQLGNAHTMHLRFSKMDSWCCVYEQCSMRRVMINVSVAWRCLAPQVLAATAA